MHSSHDVIETALSDVERARIRVKRVASKQVRTVDEIDYLKSVAYAWFKSHRPSLEGSVAGTALEGVDTVFRRVIEATAKYSARSTYLVELKQAKDALVALRTTTLVSSSQKLPHTESAPGFSSLASDVVMQKILARRWKECQTCLKAGAPLAATVMMGGLLEALFVAKANQMADKRPLFHAKTTPIDSKTKKPLQLSEWTLRPYIEVGAELGWISKSGQDVAGVLRDYRNYVHPEKERAHGITLNDHDSAMFWELTKNLTKQLLS